MYKFGAALCAGFLVAVMWSEQATAGSDWCYGFSCDSSYSSQPSWNSQPDWRSQPSWQDRQYKSRLQNQIWELETENYRLRALRAQERDRQRRFDPGSGLWSPARRQ